LWLKIFTKKSATMTVHMKAAVCTKYGTPDVLRLSEVAKPSPKNNEILVKIHATAVNSADCRLRKADPFAVRFFFGLFKPKKPILGGVLSGEVEAVGKDVRAFKVGDEVFGSAFPHFGAYAEYVCLPDTAVLAKKPTNMSHQEAAALPFGGLTAVHFLQKADVQPGQKVLIYGASGAVGSAAVQIAKSFGAEVTGVCSTANVGMVRSLGADRVVDYTATDFAKNGELYDVIYETVNKAPTASCLSALKSGGTLILGAAMPNEMLQGAWAAATTDKKVISGIAAETREAALFLQKLAENGQIKAAVDKAYALEDIAEAHRHVDGGHKKGNVVIQVN
jgi:NADPH:quinone reductase-like Zn-dependent oxidoreductase